MRIVRIGIEGFGGLVNDALDLGPGMTVVFGPNESAKTTLHAALYAALCGMRRGKGQPRTEDRDFAARHRPWGGGVWHVDALLELADGRRIELWHDLAGKVDCRAVDTGFARRDVSAEIMFEGAPDGSRWLGFDRTSFVATACVRQSSIAAVLHGASALQDELQRAAASAQRDETAGSAIESLQKFSSEQVGLERANSTRPLRRSTVELERAKAHLEAATTQHAAYLDAVARIEGLAATRDEGRRRVRLAEAVLARAEAFSATAAATRAAELAQRHPEEPKGVGGQERVANEIAEALTQWESCPAEPDLSGETIEALEAALAVVPDRPDGDLSPAQAVLDAEAELRSAEAVLAEHERSAPTVDSAPFVEVEPEELERYAAVLEREILVVDSELRERVAILRARVGGPVAARSRTPFLVGAALAVAGIVAAVAGSVSVGIALIAAGIVIAGMTFWLKRDRSETAAVDALATAERMLDEQQRSAEAAGAVRSETTERLRTLGLPDDPVQLRVKTDELRRATASSVARDEWEQRVVALRGARDTAQLGLREALRARSAGGDGEVAVELATYKTACAERERQEREASRRPALEQRLVARRAAEIAAQERAAARARLLAAAASIGSPDDEPARTVPRLREWQRSREGELHAHDDATREWAELQQLRGEHTMAELSSSAADLERRATLLGAGFSPAELEALDPIVAAAQLDDLRLQVQELESDAAESRGQGEEMAGGLPSVPEAEERLAAALNELARVRALDDVLKRTIEFLERAQERVHRSIAPILEGTLRAWLPRIVVTSTPEGIRERYDDVTVDPETLQVHVRQTGGAWRNAEFVSEGTKEQIFLLLRVALAEHLTKTGEKAPLILDEITAQCDATRRSAVLDLLHELSVDRQIVLFTHDEGALAWAEETLDLEGFDALVRRDVLEEVA